MAQTGLILLSPLDGWSAPLEEVPDSVFAQRMLGDGVAIDPTGSTLYAPCDGEIIVAPASKHAVTLRAEGGITILLHVGVDTVGLAGEGFHLHVGEGQAVRAGDRLMTFDLDLLATRARSLLTPVIVTREEQFAIARRSQDRSVQVGDFLMEVCPKNDRREARPSAPDVHGTPAVNLASRRLLVSLEQGIHARPAALMVNSLKGYSAEVSISAHGRKGNGRSAVALMALGVRKGDEIQVEATGPDAAAALESVECAMTDAAAEHERIAPRPARSAQPDAKPAASSGNALRGVVASRGLAVGRAVQLRRPEIEVPDSGTGIVHENTELDRARAIVRARLQQTTESPDPTIRGIATAHLEIIDDPMLVAGAREWVATGKSAGYAWRRVLRESIDTLRALGDSRMAERADDLLDLESQVLGVLSGQSAQPAALAQDSILLVNELLPSQLAALDTGKLAGICMAAGGPTSHVAILAAAMGVPALVAVGLDVLQVEDGTLVVLDAEGGWLLTAPSAEQLRIAREQLTERRDRRKAQLAAAQHASRTADGVRIEVFANLGSVAEAHTAVLNGAEGSGLLRTEFLFLDRTSAPDEAEQLDRYQQIASALQGRPLTFRTLDIGGDKPIPYLPLPHEENPALGLRGVRTSLWKPDLLRIQLRAVLQVQPFEQCRLLLPMITDVSEIRTVRRMVEELCREVKRPTPMAIGAMIETPASALMAGEIAREADFLSIGTNDLTQYTLAMDRGHLELASRLDGLHPAVLRLIARTVDAARENGREVAVCGGLASDPAAVPILIGLGVHELSMVPAAVPGLKALIATLTEEGCKRIAARALELETAQAVRALTRRTTSQREPVNT